MAELNMKPLEDRIAWHFEEDRFVATVRIVNELLKESFDNNARTFTFTDAGEKGLQVDTTYQDKEPKTTYLPSEFKTAVPTIIRIKCGLDFTQKVEKSEMSIRRDFERNEYDLLEHQYIENAIYNVSFPVENGLPLCIELTKINLYQQDLMENVLNETEIKQHHQAQEKIDAILAPDSEIGPLSYHDLNRLGLPLDRMEATEVLVKTLYQK